MAFKKRKDRYMQKDPTGINGLVGNFMARHGFQKQVTAAMLVRKSNDILQTLLDSHAREDIRATSFKENILKISVRHAAAGYLIASIADELRNQLLREFPAENIATITHKLDPKSFEDFGTILR